MFPKESIIALAQILRFLLGFKCLTGTKCVADELIEGELSQLTNTKGSAMAVKNLSDLYIHELKDLYSADKQSAAITARLIKAANNEKLKSALERSLEGIKTGMNTLESVCERHSKNATGKTCKGMKGLVDEVKAHVFEEDFSDNDAKDAAIIAQNQRMSHYAIAGYGTAAAFATALGHKEDVSDLKSCLDACYEGDQTFTEIAENTINNSAAA